MYRKIVISGNIIEITEYDKLNVTGFNGDRDGEGENRENNYIQRQRLRRNRIRQLITSNFDERSKFLTLTFKDTEKFDIRNVKACNHQFTLFIMRLKYRYPELKYVAVIEFQDTNDRGAVHYHIVCNLPYVPNKEIREIWGLGIIRINRIDNCDNVGAYVIKYMVKDMEDTRLQGLKAYNSSRGLIEPVEFASWKTEDIEAVNEIIQAYEGKTPSYGGQPYESENAGTILYRQFNTKKCNTQ